jgi:E3 ubiquitin-protein ligase RNF5
VPESSEADPSSSKPKESSGAFECNICLENATEPVTTLCGHLFCWACLYEWLERGRHNDCPVCKAGVTKENVIPLYGRGKNSEDPRKKPRPQSSAVPPRPSGQRPSASNRPRTEPFTDFFGGPGFQHQGPAYSFSAGFGVFPGGFMWQSGPMPGNAENVHESAQGALLSKLLLSLGLFVLFMILFYP